MKTKAKPVWKMKTIILLVGIGGTRAFGQGYIDFTWVDLADGLSKGIQVGSPSSICGQLPGYYLAGDYSVEAWMASGPGQSIFSLVPIPSTRTVFIGGPTTTAYGSPSTDGSGLWFAGSRDTGLSIGFATIQVRAWYDPDHSLTFEQALALGFNAGYSALYNINLVGSTDPTLQSLDSVGFQPFTVANGTPISCVPEPSTFMLAFIGLTALLIFTRKRASTREHSQNP